MWSCFAREESTSTDIERVAGGRTFFWRGHYEADLNVAHTDDTQLGVFADFQPKLSEASKRADVLFLGNIQPDLQRQVRAQCVTTRLAALDSMNLWIETTRDSLVAAVGVDRRNRLRVAGMEIQITIAHRKDGSATAAHQAARAAKKIRGMI